MYQSIYDQNKLQSSSQNPYSFKMENFDEFDGDIKLKKIKITQDSSLSVNKGSDTPLKFKGHLKNTYANKINHLMVNSNFIDDTNSNLESKLMYNNNSSMKIKKL